MNTATFGQMKKSSTESIDIIFRGAYIHFETEPTGKLQENIYK